MMKRILTFTMLALFCTGAANAQFSIGVKAGVNAGKIDGKSFKDEFNYSYLLGGFAEIGLGNRISVNPEVLFSQTSSTLVQDQSEFPKDQVKAKLNYLSIPILLNVKLAGPLHIEAGPQFGILLNNDKTVLENGGDAFKKGDFSLAAGAGLNFNILRITGRYVVGLSNIGDATDQDKWKSQALQLSVGLAF